MSRHAVNVIYVLVMVVGVDVLLFRRHFWERLAVNVGIVLAFVGCYFRFVSRPWPARRQAARPAAQQLFAGPPSRA